MQSPSKIRKAVALVTKADEKALPIRTGRTSSANVAGTKASDSGNSDSSDPFTPNIFVLDRSGVVPQLVAIETVCAMLALRKSAVYDLVAKRLLEPPCKLTPGRRGASRWLLSSVIKFIQALADQRTMPAWSNSLNSTEPDHTHATALTTSKAKKARQTRSPSTTAESAS
jgi:predicted DNA-binding transcriptional regulator AlpA